MLDKKYYTILLLSILLIIFLAGCSSNNTTDNIIKSNSLYKVEGTIISKENNEPILEAKVSIDNKSTFTNDQGYYVIKDIQKGSYEWKVSKPNYNTHREDIVINDDSTLNYQLTTDMEYTNISGDLNINNSSQNSTYTSTTQSNSNNTSSINDTENLSILNLNNQYKEDEVIIKFKENISSKAMEKIKNINLLSKLKEIKIDNKKIVKYKIAKNKDVREIINTYRFLPGIDWIEPNYILQALAQPNDPYYTDQWSKLIANLEAGWDKEVGNRSVTVAVVDSGIIPCHPDLENNLISENLWADFVDGNESGDPSNYEPTDNDPTDETTKSDGGSHGTHVSGIIGAVTNNDKGIAGVNWDINILPLRVLKTDSSGNIIGSSFDVAEAVYYAVDNGADIINMSLGRAGSESQLEKDYLTYAKDHNALVFAASGNEGTNTVLYPAKYDYSIAVGAVDIYNNITSYTNTGEALDLVAPGGSSSYPVYSTWGYYESGNTYPDYVGMYGTSMSTPHVSGIAALLIANGVNPTDIKDRLISTAVDIEDSDGNLYKLVDAYGALLNKKLNNPYVFAGTISDNEIDIKSEVVISDDDNNYLINSAYPSQSYVFAWRDVNGNQKVDHGDYYGKTNSTITIEDGSNHDNIDLDIYYIPENLNEIIVNGLATIED